MNFPNEFKDIVINYNNKKVSRTPCAIVFKNCNGTSHPKNYDYSNVTEPNIVKIYQVRDSVNYTKQNKKTIFIMWTYI